MSHCVDRLERIESAIRYAMAMRGAQEGTEALRALHILALEARRCTRADAVLSHIRGVLATGGPHTPAEAAQLDYLIEQHLGPLPRADQAAKPR